MPYCGRSLNQTASQIHGRGESERHVMTKDTTKKTTLVLVTNHHLAGGVLGQTAHHGVHLVKLLGGGLHVRVDLLVLCILVVEHSSVLVPLLVRLY